MLDNLEATHVNWTPYGESNHSHVRVINAMHGVGIQVPAVNPASLHSADAHTLQALRGTVTPLMDIVADDGVELPQEMRDGLKTMHALLFRR
ncbi:hypothetical protein LIER_35007 [Lithospermum erythrorhizon]|uniref:Uncharacterized protein n=1 Tax=Lithospermum erythrorhizon TaxID=34254 RepID=A0AAV3NII9_LITER